MDRNQITVANQRNSPLLHLPAERRNRIYHYVFYDNEVHITNYGPKYRERLPQNTLIDTLDLVSTCAQLRHETLPCLYENTTFCVYYEDIETFIRDMSPTMRHQIKFLSLAANMTSEMLRGTSRYRFGLSAFPSYDRELPGLERAHIRQWWTVSYLSKKIDECVYGLPVGAIWSSCDTESLP